MPSIPIEPTWLRADTLGPLVDVDRKNKILRGFVVAQEGPFKTPGRGEFDLDGLKSIVTLMNAPTLGVKSRFSHPTLSDDGIGKFLGRARGAFLDRDRVRADLHLDPSSFDTPSGNLGGYVLDLAESDSDALSSSLVLDADEEFRVDTKGRALEDGDGTPLPPLWRPQRIHATDIVDTGDAVDGLLSADSLPDAAVRQGAALLDRAFAGQPRDVIEARCQAWLKRYLEYREGRNIDSGGESSIVELPDDERADVRKQILADRATAEAIYHRLNIEPRTK